MTVRTRMALAIAAAVVAALLMGAYSMTVKGQSIDQRAEALRRYGGETVSVCVASRDIARGELFSERNVQTVEWLVDLLPEGALTDASQLTGKASAAPIAKNSALSLSCIDDTTQVLEVPHGLVAVSVPCSAETAVGGAVSPNSVVDVYVIDGGAARLLAGGVQVLQTGAGISGSGQSWVTVAVPADLVEAVIAASSLQRLYLALPSQ